MKKVTIEFIDGKVINLDLDENAAPLSVANFVKLATGGFYDGLCFHRVIPGFMIQGGGFKLSEEGLVPTDAQTIKGEFAANGINNPIRHTAGVISMARTNVKDSASSQFFICVADCPHLDGQYAAFGKVSDRESLETAIAISKVQTGRWMHFDDVPTNGVVIKTVKVG